MAHDLIYSRSHNNTPLPRHKIQELAPAAFGTEADNRTSDQYTHIRTADLFPLMADHGLHPVQAVQVQARKRPMTTAQHLIAFASDRAEAGETRPEVILYNSGDGLSSLKMFAGQYRFICSNGMVAGEGFEARAVHKGTSFEAVEQMLDGILRRVPDMLAQTERMSLTRPNSVQVQTFLRKAAATRWKDMEAAGMDVETGNPYPGTYAADWTYRQLDTVRREGDYGSTAWAYFNRAQESLIRGGVEVLSITEKNPYGARRKARPINSVAASVDVNRQLWDAAMEMAA